MLLMLFWLSKSLQQTKKCSRLQSMCVKIVWCILCIGLYRKTYKNTPTPTNILIRQPNVVVLAKFLFNFTRRVFMNGAISYNLLIQFIMIKFIIIFATYSFFLSLFLVPTLLFSWLSFDYLSAVCSRFSAICYEKRREVWARDLECKRTMWKRNSPPNPNPYWLNRAID